MSQSKKVVIAINRLGVGGAERLVIEDVNEFVRRGWDVCVVTFSPEKEHTLAPTLPEPCRLKLVPFTSLYSFHSYRALAAFLKTESPDIIISHLWHANFITRVAARWARLHGRTISFEQNLAHRVKNWKQLWSDYVLQRWCRFVIAVCAEVEDSLIQSGISPSRIRVIVMALDPRPIQRAVPSGIRAELGLGQEYLYLFVGRLTKQKAVDVLLRAFAALPAGVLLLAGQGEEREKLEAQTKALGIGSRVFFLGVRNDVPGLMKSADCFVFPSRWEPFGMVLLEAMAASTPIVVSDFPTVFEIVKKEESALIVAREDSLALTQAMDRMRLEPGLGKRLAQHASRELLRFSPQRHVDAILALFG